MRWKPRAARAARARKARRACARLHQSDDGQSLVEFAVLVPFLLIVLVGIVEFGNALNISHALLGYSREGANIAARGTPLDTVVSVITLNGAEIDLGSRGGTVASRVELLNGVPYVREQVGTPAFIPKSRIGVVDSTAAAFSGLGLLDGQFWVVELFYEYRPLTGLDNFMGIAVPDTIYRWSFF